MMGDDTRSAARGDRAEKEAPVMVDQPAAEDDKTDLKESFKEALARKHARNTHPEAHLDGHTVGTSTNDTRKRQFRRKSG
jgi:hypothetical protein